MKRPTQSLYLVIFTLLLCFPLVLTGAKVESRGNKTHLPSYQQQLFDYYYYDAIKCMNSNQIDRALLLLQHCVYLDPQNSSANAILGRIYLVMQQNERALACIEISVKSEPTNWRYRKQYIELLLQLNQLDQAIAQTQQALRLDDQNEEIYPVLAQLYKGNKDYNKAITTLNKLEKISGITEFASFEKYRLYSQIGKLKKGIEEIEKLVAENPDNSQYSVMRGDIYLEQKMYDQAYAIFQEVLVEEPENPFVYLSLAEYYNVTNQTEKAFEPIMQALENTQLDVDTKIAILMEYSEKLITHKLNTEHLEGLLHTLLEQYPLEEQVHYFHTLYLLEHNKIDEAKQTLRTMLDINPQNPHTWRQLLDFEIQAENTEGILSLTAQAIEATPREPEWYFYRAVALTRKGQIDEALATYLSALPYLQEENKVIIADFYAQIADIYYLKKDRTKSFEYYEKAYRYAPQNVNLLNNYAYHLSLENTDLKKAEKMSAKTVEKEPSNPVYLDTYAWIFYQQENYSLAKFYIERAIDNLTDEMRDPEIWEHYGFILFKAGKVQEALQAWRTAVEYGCENPDVLTVLKNIIHIDPKGPDAIPMYDDTHNDLPEDEAKLLEAELNAASVTIES